MSYIYYISKAQRATSPHKPAGMILSAVLCLRVEEMALAHQLSYRIVFCIDIWIPAWQEYQLLWSADLFYYSNQRTTIAIFVNTQGYHTVLKPSIKLLQLKNFVSTTYYSIKYLYD